MAADGTVLKHSDWQPLCTEFHRRHPETLQRCAESDAILARSLQPGEPFAIHTCRNGLTDALAPIVVDGEHVANWMVGQFILGPPDAEAFREQAIRCGFDDAAYMAALSQVPVVSEPTVRTVLDAMVGFAELLADMGLSAMRHLLDISEREQAQEELGRERNLLRTLVDALPDQVFVKDRESRFLLANQTVLQGLGCGCESEILGKTDLDLMPEADARRHAEEERTVIATGLGFAGREYSCEGERGATEYFLSTKMPLQDASGEVVGLVGINHSITDLRRAEQERRKLEAQVHRAQRLESLGVLAGGIAHDFNNVLAAIIGFAEMARTRAADDSVQAKHLDHVLQASDRAAGLVRQILAFTRQATGETRPTCLAPVVREALQFLRSSMPSTIEIVQHADPTCGPVLADPTQIHQVIVNLCTNAHHAMRERGGVLDVSLERVHMGDHPAELYDGLSAGDYVRLTVSDTGCGMDETVRERIFEPFFTTKDRGEGTGLGLAVTHGIVAAHGGVIRVYSEPGLGSTFHVYLPCCEGESRHDPPAEQPMAGGSERVLLVDDEQALTVMSSEMLTSLGYDVTLHTESLAALQAFSATPGAFDIVVTDQTMPRLTGLDLAERVRAIRPDVPVLLMTGFSHQVETRGTADTVNGILMKPYTCRRLSQAVREALGDGRG